MRLWRCGRTLTDADVVCLVKGRLYKTGWGNARTVVCFVRDGPTAVVTTLWVTRVRVRAATAWPPNSDMRVEARETQVALAPTLCPLHAPKGTRCEYCILYPWLAIQIKSASNQLAVRLSYLNGHRMATQP
jgi:hypothetical protein